jgi:hypothetical protein
MITTLSNLLQFSTNVRYGLPGPQWAASLVYWGRAPTRREASHVADVGADHDLRARAASWRAPGTKASPRDQTKVTQVRAGAAIFAIGAKPTARDRARCARASPRAHALVRGCAASHSGL